MHHWTRIAVSWVFVFPVVLRPVERLKILVGPGWESEARARLIRERRAERLEGESAHVSVEHEPESGRFLFRVGVRYVFELKERYSIAPTLETDFVNEPEGVTTAIVYGLAFGFGF